MAYLLMLNLFYNLKIKVDTKQISAVFLCELKMEHKVVKKTQSINSTIGPGTINNIQCNMVVQKVQQTEMRASKTTSIVASQRNLTMANPKQSFC